MSYKASVSNIYELLNEDGGATPQVNIGGSDNAPTKKTTPAPAKTQPKPKQETPKAADRSSQPKAPRPERSIDRRPKEFSSPKAGEEDTTDKERRVNRDSGERRFGEQRGRGGFVPRGNKRPFDRRSGTGRGKEDKKGGAGKGNWGTVDDEQKAAEEGYNHRKKPEGQEPQGEQPQATETQTEQKEVQREPEEEEDKTRTLDEFFKAKASVKIDLPKARQAGEGVSDADWKGFVPLKKKEDEALTTPKEEKKKESKKPVVSANDMLNFKIQEESPSRQRRDKFPTSQRGGRGGKRGGGSGRSAPNVQDEAAFPSLSTKA